MAETNKDMFQYAKDLAKTEKELQIHKWVSIEIGYYEKRQFICLYKYDLPRKVYEKRSWVIRWRCSKCQCKFPKQHIGCYFSYYDKRSGLPLGFGTELSKLAAAKAQVTKVKRNIKEYIERNNTSLFFDEQNDELLNTAKKKLSQKIAAVRAAEERLERLVKEQNNT